MRLQGPAKRIAIAVAALVTLVALAVGIAVWRYGAANDAEKEALGLAQTQFFAQQVRTDVTDEGGIADAYASDGNTADLADLARVKKSLFQALNSLKKSPGLSVGESGIVAKVAAEQRRLESIFRNQLVPV